jgi:Spy/CpxP family protein refolding chaperone
MKTHSKILGSALVSAITLAVVFSIPTVSGAQRGGANIRSIVAPQSRLIAMEKSFELTKEQKNAVKLLMDTAHKDAAPIREGLTRTHAALGAAVQAGKDQAEIDAAAKAYAEQAAAMAAAEMKAMAAVMKQLTEAQRAMSPAISATFFNMRGAFLDNKKWDDVPESRVRY